MRFVFLLAFLAAMPACAADHFRCGVITEPLDWNKTDLHASLVPLEAEICKAIATARFGNSAQLEIKPFRSEQEGLEAVHAGQVDVAAGVTPDFLQGAKNKLRFSVPFFLDAQGFMVHREEGVHTLADIAGHKLCYIEDTDNDPIVLGTLAAKGIRPVPFGFQEEGEMDAAIMDRHCQVVSAYLTKLAEARATFRNARDYVFLPDLLSVSPVTVATPVADPRLSAIVDATIGALLQAEFLHVTRASISSLGRTDDPRLQRLLGDDYASAVGLDLPHDWSRKVIEAVGNYGEIYDRTVGAGTPLDLKRGLNALWSDGGSLVPLPLR